MYSESLKQNRCAFKYLHKTAVQASEAFSDSDCGKTFQVKGAELITSISSKNKVTEAEKSETRMTACVLKQHPNIYKRSKRMLFIRTKHNM